jgi:hypothetical protein
LLNHAAEPEATSFVGQVSDDGALESQDGGVTSRTSLPGRQMTALCSIRLVDPVAFTQIFPYINEFMTDMKVTNDPAQVGFYSGVVVNTSFPASFHDMLTSL